MTTDDSADVRWLTYDAMAEALGITPDSARRLAARNKHWPRKTNNDGRTLVGVPVERIPDKAPDATPDDTADTGPDGTADVSLAVSILAQTIERLEKELEAVKAERDEERVRVAALALRAAQADALTEVLAIERQRLEEAKADHSRRIEEQTQRLQELRTDRDQWIEQARTLLAEREQLAAQRRGWFGWLKRA